MAGDLKIFGLEFTDCPFCEQIDVLHWWDHVTLHCASILPETVPYSREELGFVDPSIRGKIGDLIGRRWDIARKKLLRLKEKRRN